MIVFIKKAASFCMKFIYYYKYICIKPFYRYYYKKNNFFYKRFSPFSRPLTQGIRQCDRRMLVDIERKFMFNRIAKVASSALMATLCPAPENKESYIQYRKKHKKPSQLKKREVVESEKFFKFIFVRCPYNRVLSAYLHKIGSSDKKRKSYMKKTPELFKKYGKRPSFYDFCKYLESGGLYDNKHWAPQTSLMALPVEEFDFIGKIENIKDDFRFVARKVNSLKGKEIARTGPYTGASDKIKQYYNAETEDIIFKLYKDDFEAFGYSYKLKK